jgi:hypothetical protein
VAKSFSSKNEGFSGAETCIFLKIQWKKEKKIKWQKMPIFELIFDFRAERKRSRAQPS